MTKDTNENNVPLKWGTKEWKPAGCPCDTIKSFKRMMELVRCFKTKRRMVVPKPEHWRKGE